MKTKLRRKSMLIALVFTLTILVFSQGRISSAAKLSNVSYSYYNDGDMGENSLSVSIKGKNITIKAGMIDKEYGGKCKTYKKFKKTFKITSKLSRYYCLTSDKYTGKVTGKKFKEDLMRVKKHTYGSIKFYVKGNRIVGYEIYG